MSLQSRLTQPVTVQTIDVLPDADNYGNQVQGVTVETDLLAYLEQTQTRDNTIDRETITFEWFCILPATATIEARDRVVYGDRTFEVIGEPDHVYNPRTRSVSHIEVTLRGVTG